MWGEILVALVGGVSIGAIIERIIDVAWLGRIQERRERKKWLLDKRHESFVRISQQLLSLGLGEDRQKDSWELLHVSAEARLVIEDKSLADRIHRFIGDLHRYDSYSKTEDASVKITTVDGQPVSKGDMQIISLEKEARLIVDELSKEILTQ